MVSGGSDQGKIVPMSERDAQITQYEEKLCDIDKLPKPEYTFLIPCN
jgi:hypothetical protein